MSANLSPEYKKAEQAFRAAHEARERLVCLKEMLRTIPKHKGTEHIQADIKSRMRQLTDELNTCAPQLFDAAADPSVMRFIREHYGMIGRC
jgi:hypothetical protein